MNITEHRLNIAHQLEELSEESLCELEKIIVQLKAKPKQKTKRQAGYMKGLVVYIAEDFDAPLEDFKEYME